ncbi:hypothetical protein [uncultured Aliiroseovarius sp.]|uniref:hypothetical protein n=1 Tax=uncultured Aliiroseovarius sp. TaxID=1658783 RepID=UPI0025942900|nr:hypothetical protein [uncultured Aliiroseovarius sp.]
MRQDIHQFAPSLMLRSMVSKFDSEILRRLAWRPRAAPFDWPYHTKSELSGVIDLKSDRPDISIERCALLMCIGTPLSVDSYFQMIRSNVHPAPRPLSTPSANGETLDWHFRQMPVALVSIIESYAFITTGWDHATRNDPGNQIRLPREISANVISSAVEADLRQLSRRI